MVFIVDFVRPETTADYFNLGNYNSLDWLVSAMIATIDFFLSNNIENLWT